MPPPSLPPERAKVADFYAARSETIPPLPWQTFAPPFPRLPREAIFAEVPATVDLTETPFVYLRQYETANRLLAVPFAELLGVASELPPIDRFVMMYMTGRCGSTLLSHAFNAVDGAVSLSEPDAPIELVRAQRAKALPPEEDPGALFEASVRLLFRTTKTACRRSAC